MPGFKAQGLFIPGFKAQGLVYARVQGSGISLCQGQRPELRDQLISGVRAQSSAILGFRAQVHLIPRVYLIPCRYRV